jgi:hypothetical protein
METMTTGQVFSWLTSKQVTDAPAGFWLERQAVSSNLSWHFHH